MLNINTISDAALKEQILNEIQLLQSQVKLAEQLNDASIDQIIAYDKHGKIISCNKTCAERWNKDSQSVLGMNILNALPAFAEIPALAKAMNFAKQGFKSFVPYDKDFYNYGYYEHHFIPLKNEAGDVEKTLVVIHDIAHRIKAEEALKQLNEELSQKNHELKELNKEILAFAYIAGNDLKWPLRKIYSLVEIILQDEGASLTARAKSYCRKVQSAAQKMSLLTDDIGSLSIINPDTFKPERIDLNELLMFVKKQNQNKLINKNITINAADLPVLEASRMHMEKLFHCLINHAIKSSETNHLLEISISANAVNGADIVHDNAKNQLYHILRFSDNRTGVDILQSNDIFNLYNYMTNPLPRGNTGINLAISKKICDMHGGFIFIEHAPRPVNTICCCFPFTGAETSHT